MSLKKLMERSLVYELQNYLTAFFWKNNIFCFVDGALISLHKFYQA